MRYLISFALALLLALYYYHRSQPPLSRLRRALLLALRTLMLFILLNLLLNPIIYFVRSYSEIPLVIVLQDKSLSMDLKSGGHSKKQILKPKIEEVKKKYQEAGYRVKEFAFADGLDGDKNNSLLIKSLEELGSKLNLQEAEALVLASDGWLRDENLSMIGKLGLPINCVADSTREETPDLELIEIQANRYGYRGEDSLFRLRVKAENYGASAQLNFWVGKRLVHSQKLDFSQEQEQSVDMVHRFNELGFYHYKAELAPLEKEQKLGNNSLPGAIEVLAEKEQIWVISDSPAWDNKFILDAIATNPRWESSAYQAAGGRLLKGEQAVRLEAKSNPAVIVLINNGKLRLDGQNLEYILQAFKKGSGIFYQGLPLDELAEILPFKRSNIESSYQGFLVATPAAKSYSMLAELSMDLSKLPPLDYYYVNPGAGATLLYSINNPQSSPGLMALEKGQSRSLGLSFLNLWRWQLQSPELRYQKFVVNSLTWLSNKALGSYSAIYQNSYFLGEEIKIRLRAEDDTRLSNLDASPLIQIFNAKDEELRKDFMTRQGSEFFFAPGSLEAGEYRFKISEGSKSETGRFVVAEQAAEVRDFGFNLPLLEYIAGESRGRMIYDSGEFKPLKAQKQSRILKSEFALYKKWYILLVFIAAFATELFFRRRWGLL